MLAHGARYYGSNRPWRVVIQTPRYALLASLLAAGCQAVPRHEIDPQKAPLPRRYVCQHTAQPIAIDGRLDDAAWAAAPWTGAFVDICGTAWTPVPRFATRAKLLWDDQNLYIGAQLDEPHVWATLTAPDAIVYHDNDFEIFIDPDGDARNYYEIEVNALGTLFDLILERTYIEGGPARHEWQLAGMQAAVHVDGTLNDPRNTDQGWSVEFALPWAGLAEYARCPSPPRPGDTWRVNFSRVEWQVRTRDGRYTKIADTPEDNWVWSPPGVINMHLPQYWGYVEFAGSPWGPSSQREP